MLTLAQLKAFVTNGEFSIPTRDGIQTIGDTTIRLGHQLAGEILIEAKRARIVFEYPLPKAQVACNVLVSIHAIEVTDDAAFAETGLGKYKITAEKVDDD